MGQIINAERSPDFVCYASAELVEGRRVLEVTYSGGAYGFGGGYGFFGLKLKKTRRRPHEWLVCTLLGATDWLTIGDQWLSAHPGLYHEQVPLVGYGTQLDEQGRQMPTGERWDHFTPMAVDQDLKTFQCDHQSCRLLIGDLVVEIAADHRKRPILYGNQQPRQLEPGENLQRAWIMAKDAYLMI